MNMYKFTIIVLLSLMLGSGCKAPIQLSNITFIEHFKQDFDFRGVTGDKVDFVGEILSINEKPNMFTDYVRGGTGMFTQKSLENNEIGTDGVVTFTLSLLPFSKNPSKFDVSGTGHYDIINKENNEIYFTSTFHFVECLDCSDIGSLIEKDSFTLRLKFTQVAINQMNYPPGKDASEKVGIKYRHIPNGFIVVHINLIKQKKYGNKCFSINYGDENNPYKHPIYFEKVQSDTLKTTPLGTLEITPPTDLGSRIIDLKNMNFLIRKYK